MGRMKASEIRELLKLLDQPDIISFAGGIPDPALFPAAAFQAGLCGCAVAGQKRTGAAILGLGGLRAVAHLDRRTDGEDRRALRCRQHPDHLWITASA